MTIWLFLLHLAQGGPILDVLDSELHRAVTHFSTLEEKPHYIAMGITEETSVQISAQDGAVSPVKWDATRNLDTDMRVGTPLLDSTHELRGFSGFEGSRRMRIPLPTGDDHMDAIRHIVWRELDHAYRDSSERIVMLRANQVVKVAEEDPAPDFEPRKSVQDQIHVPDLTLDEAGWTSRIQRIAEAIDNNQHVYQSRVRLKAVRQAKTFIDTEGARIEHGARFARLSLTIQTRAEDGDQIDVFRAFDVHDVNSLPDQETLDKWAGDAMQHLLALREAPRGEPYTGPVLLRGKATGVFFHEVFGHRVEGHRQKSDYEGKTFADHVGLSILPDFIDVYDDPTIAKHGTNDLNGYYHYDDEGVAAQRASLVEKGKFTGFLMGRSPIPGFEHSNGHGRRMTGYAPVSRMGNTIVHARKSKTDAQLRAQLLRIVKAQGLEYGYIVEDIDGGFTMTGRITPNAFNVRANTTWRVFVDGRPDELVRGIDLVGTPMVAFKSILAAGSETAVFNGHCGAESGWVPVSAVAPSVLLGRLEFQRKEKSSERPPLLARPDTKDGHSDAQGVTP